MKKIRKKQANNVILLKKREATKMSERKWGKRVISQGFSIVPSLIFKAQRRLGLTPTQLAVLLQLADFWWDEARKPFPSKRTLSNRLNLSPRQIQRIIADLESQGLVERIQRFDSFGGKTSNGYDLSGLVEKLQALEPEFREVESLVKEEREEVTKPKHKRKIKKAAT